MKFDSCFPCFPNEVSLKIFSYFSPKDLETCATVSIGFRDLSTNTKQWLAPTWDSKDWEAFTQLSEELGFKTHDELAQLVCDHPAFQYPDFQPTNPKNPIRPAIPSPLEFAFHCLRDARKVRKDLTAETIKAILDLPVLSKSWGKEKLTVDDFVGDDNTRLIQDETGIDELSTLINKRYLVAWLLCTAPGTSIRQIGITDIENTLCHLLSRKCFQTALNLLRDPQVQVAFNIGYNTLHWTASLGHRYSVWNKYEVSDEILCIDIVDELIEQGVDVNEADPRIHNTALQSAAAVGAIEMVKHLVEKHHARIDQPDHYARTPLLEAVEWGRDKVAAYLLKKDADPNPGNNRKPLNKAIENRHFKIAQCLLDYGAVYEDQYFFEIGKSSDVIINAAQNDRDAQAVKQFLVGQHMISV